MELRKYLFSGVKDQKWNFKIFSKQSGIFSGSAKLEKISDELKVEREKIYPEGYKIEAGDCVFSGRGKRNRLSNPRRCFWEQLESFQELPLLHLNFLKRRPTI